MKKVRHITTRHKELLNDFELLVNPLGGIVYEKDDTTYIEFLLKYIQLM